MGLLNYNLIVTHLLDSFKRYMLFDLLVHYLVHSIMDLLKYNWFVYNSVDSSPVYMLFDWYFHIKGHSITGLLMDIMLRYKNVTDYNGMHRLLLLMCYYDRIHLMVTNSLHLMMFGLYLLQYIPYYLMVLVYSLL